jgi:hypothetical protein
MPGRLGPRFALEAGFLIMLAVALGLADLSATAIVVVMGIAWLLVAVIELIASRESGYPSHTSWPPAPPNASPAPPEWGGHEHEETAFIPPAVDGVEDEDTDPAASMVLPSGSAAEAPDAPRKRRWGRRSGRSEGA